MLRVVLAAAAGGLRVETAEERPGSDSLGLSTMQNARILLRDSRNTLLWAPGRARTVGLGELVLPAPDRGALVIPRMRALGVGW